MYGFSWVLQGELAGMPVPIQFEAQALQLQALGVGAVVSLTLNGWPDDALSKAGLRYLHMPIRDFAPPTPAQVDEFVAFCEACIQTGRPVVVHCTAGRGRTGTMIACFLVHRGNDAPEAIRCVRETRPGSIETVEQERAVHDYAARLRKEN